MYGDPESRTAGKFRADEISDIAQRYISMAPYARHGFEVVVIDPPSIADVLDSVVGINRGRGRADVIPVHIRCFRTRVGAASTDEEDFEMEDLASTIKEIRGTLEIDPAVLSLDQIIARLTQRQAHLTLVFEPGEASSFKIGIDVSPTLSPLIVPRQYSYDQLEDQFDVVIQGDATPFGSYYGLFRDLLNLPEGNTIGRRSGASTWIPALGRIAEFSMWLSIIDQGIEPTLQIPGAVRLDKRSTGGRDIHTFTSHHQTIRRYVEKVVQVGGLVPDLPTVTRTLDMMQRLGGDTIPIVVSSASSTGQVVLQQARGLLGVLAVARWYSLDSSDALVISLDTESSRRWILGATENDGRRGDLLCLRQTVQGLVLEVVEVKARSDEQGFVKVRKTRDASRLEGTAIGQIDATVAILKRLFVGAGIGGVDKARREILRDQLYMAVANRSLTPSQRDRAVQMLHEFFREGPSAVRGRLFIVHIESHSTIDFPVAPRDFGISPDGNEVEVFELVESEDLADDGSSLPDPTVPSVPPPPTVPDSKRDAKRPVATKVSVIPEPLPPTPESPPDVPELPAQPPDAPPTEPVTDGTTESLVVSLGSDPTGTKDITWDTAANPNFGFLVTGDTGFGKSQTIRAVIAEARRRGFPVTIFDFKRDYANEPEKHDFFADDNRLTVYDVVNKGLPFNPLELMPNETGVVQPVRQAYELASIIQRIENLGEKQYNAFVEAICAAYEKRGIRAKARLQVSEITQAPPVFDDVIAELRDADDSYSESVRIRLQKFSDLGLFPPESSPGSFEEMINGGTVLLLNDAANEKLMQVLGEILIVKLHALLKRGDQPRRLRRLLVLDEAWRVARSQRLVELAREGRSFGVGMLIGTQNPKDMPENLVSCLRTQLFLYNKDLDNQRVIVRQLCNTTSGPDAQQRLQTVANLSPFQGYLISEQYKQGIRVNVTPYYMRRREQRE
jgi:hypothetical protein